MEEEEKNTKKNTTISIYFLVFCDSWFISRSQGGKRASLHFLYTVHNVAFDFYLGFLNFYPPT